MRPINFPKKSKSRVHYPGTKQALKEDKEKWAIGAFPTRGKKVQKKKNPKKSMGSSF